MALQKWDKKVWEKKKKDSLENKPKYVIKHDPVIFEDKIRELMRESDLKTRVHGLETLYMTTYAASQPYLKFIINKYRKKIEIEDQLKLDIESVDLNIQDVPGESV